MRLAFIHQPWSIVRPGQTGADSVVLWTEAVSRRLAARGCEVTCYSRSGDGLPVGDWVDGVEHRRIAAPVDRYVKFALGKMDKWGLRHPTRPAFASAWVYRQFIERVTDELLQRSTDIVHVHNFSQFMPILRQALPNAATALHMHCEWLTQLNRQLVARRIESTSLVIGVSDFVAGKIRARFPEFKERIRKVWNGADVEKFQARAASSRIGQPTKRILYIGRVSPEKGIHTLLDAFAEVIRHDDSIELHIIGPERIVPYEMIVPFCDDPKVQELTHWFRGGYADHLRRRIAELPRGRAQWHDRELTHDELPQHYAKADLFVFPSIWDEPFGMPLVEAMSAGLACVATRGGAFPEIVIDGETGLLVHRADRLGLAEAILRLSRDDVLRQRLGDAGRERARRLFSWDHVAESLLDEYKRIHDRPETRAADMISK